MGLRCALHVRLLEACLAGSMFPSVPAGGMDKRVLIREIVNELKKGNNVGLIAPTGWGKTLAAFEVAAELAREGHGVGLFFPTRTLAVQKWSELLAVQNPPPSAILTAGAQQLCAYRWQYPQRHCRRCVLYRPQRIDAPPFLTYSELDKMAPDNACAYWIQEELLPQFKIIIGHYGRMQKILPHVDYAVWDEVQELFIPNISSMPLAEIAEALNVSVQDLHNDVNVIKEYAEAKLIGAEPAKEDVIYSVLQMLRSTCWIEDGALHCLEMRQMPSGVPSLMLTATPPPGWPPEGWGRKIEIKPKVKPQAYLEPEVKFYYKDNYEGIALQLYLVIQWLKKKFGAKCIVVFAISSVQRVLGYGLPMEFARELPRNEDQIPPSGVVVLDAWGKHRVGVNAEWCDAAVLTWPSLHVAARRRFRAEGKNPDMAELLVAVQHAGRIMRPRPGESYEGALRERVVAMIDGRFWNFRQYLAQFFTIEELPEKL